MGAKRLELLPAAARTGTGNGDTFQLQEDGMLFVGVYATAGSGTVTVWLEGSNDGVRWFDIIAEHTLEHLGVAAGALPIPDTRQIVNDVTVTTVRSVGSAVYKRVGAQMVRVQWDVDAGTLTFGVRAVAKE